MMKRTDDVSNTTSQLRQGAIGAAVRRFAPRPSLRVPVRLALLLLLPALLWLATPQGATQAEQELMAPAASLTASAAPGAYLNPARIVSAALAAPASRINVERSTAGVTVDLPGSGRVQGPMADMGANELEPVTLTCVLNRAVPGASAIGTVTVNTLGSVASANFTAWSVAVTTTGSVVLTNLNSVLDLGTNPPAITATASSLTVVPQPAASLPVDGSSKFAFNRGGPTGQFYLLSHRNYAQGGPFSAEVFRYSGDGAAQVINYSPPAELNLPCTCVGCPTPTPALSLSKTASPTAEIAYRGIVTYTLILSNSGGADGAVILTDTLPAEATFARWIEQNGAAIDAGQLTWGSAAVDAGAAITVSFAVTNTAGGGATITNTACFRGALQTGSVAAAYATATTLAPSGSGNWSEVFPPCTGVCKYTIPAGVAITLTTDIELTGDFEVESGGTLAPNGRSVTLTGDRAQTLTGNPLTFYNLVVNKTSKSDTATIVGKLKVTKKLTVRKGSLVSASTYEDLEIAADGVLTLTSPITITGHFTNAGELNTEGNTARFAGGKEQNLVLEVMTWFDDLEVYTGTTLIEAIIDDNAYVQGALINYGVIRKTRPVDTDNDFGLAGEYGGADLAITIVTTGSLTAIQVDRIDQPQPNGPASGGEPIYWTITGTGSDFVADVTLPHRGLVTPLACRYGKDLWTCANTASDADSVTFGRATAFSDWAAYGCYPSVTVTATADSGAGSLRQAIADVCPGGVVDFNLSYPATITLTSEQLTVLKDMTIAGPGAANLAVSGANARRVFSITTGITVTLDGLTLRDGNADAENGGGIYNRGTLTLTHSSVLSNAAANGGGMYNTNTNPTLTGVVFRGNQASNSGGAMYNDGAGAKRSSPSLVNVTFNGNSALAGGAIYNNGSFSGTSSPSLVNVTFSGNWATNAGGAIFNFGYGTPPGTVRPDLVSVILWENVAGGNGAQVANLWAAPLISHSLIPSTTVDIYNENEYSNITWGAGNITSADADPLFVAPIAASSAPTTTGDYRLRACSPVIDAGDNLSVTVATDLDGNPRIVNGVVDMGAYEAALMPCLHLAKAVTPTTNVPYQGVVTYTVVLSNSGVLTGTVALTDALPAEVAFGGWVESHGAEHDGNVITWSGEITPATTRTYIFTATHTSQTLNQAITNTATFSGALQTGSAAAAFAQMRLIYVDKDASGPTYDGLAWTTAYTNVQDALGVANANAGTRYEIWVAEGTYYPDEGAGAIDNSRTMSFTLRYDNVQLYGGFAATETLRTQRDWVAHPTILSGDIDQDSALTNNAYHVLYLAGVTDPNITAATVIDGFTVTGGNADHASLSRFTSGGGLYCDGSGTGNECSPTIANVTFTGNQAKSGGAIYNDGGYGMSSPNLVNIIFSGNRADNGGAMYNAAPSGMSSPNLVNVTFNGNQAARHGGAMYNVGGSGGVSSPSLVDVIFSGNQAGHDGGAMYNFGLAGTSSPSLDNVMFIGNLAGDSGGAVYNASVIGISNPVLTNVTFGGNRAARFGGAMYHVGSGSTCSPSLANVILWGNTAITGTHVANIDATLSIRNSLIPSTTGDIFSTGSSTITWGAGNLTSADADPLFVAPITATAAPTTTGDYRLRACSPVIDAGDNLSVNVATDLDGNPRIVNGVVDMGAYEAALMPCLHLAKAVTPTTNVPYQGVVTYTVVLSNSGNLTDTATLTDALPAQVAFGGWVENPGAGVAENIISWRGEIAPAMTRTYIFTATHGAAASITVTNTGDFSGTLQAGQATAAFTTVKANTATALARDPSPSTFGQPVVFTATVAAPGGGTPTGVVTFSVGANTYTATLLSGVAAYTAASLPVGSHAVIAAYCGDANFTASVSAPMTQTVNSATTATTLVSTPNPSAFGQIVSFTATVTATLTGVGAPTGIMTFTAGTTPLGAINLANGVAVVSTSELDIGSHAVTASYGGDTNFTASLSPIATQVVVRSAVAVNFTAAPNPASYGEAVSVAMTVTTQRALRTGDLGVQSMLGPSGVVTLYDGAAAVTSAVLVDGAATTRWPLPATGDHALTVAYGGDEQHVANVSAPGVLTVQQTGSATALTAPSAATAYGEPVTCTVTVNSALLQGAGSAPAAPWPTGQVQVKDGATVVGDGLLRDGVATVEMALLAGGVHALTAEYAGDTNYVASTALSVNHTVTPASAQVSLASVPNPATAGVPIVFTATVQAASLTPGRLVAEVAMDIPSGQVTFREGQSVLGEGTLANGVATLATTVLPAGEHFITAHYAGDANYQAAISGGVTQTVLWQPLARNDAAGVLAGEAVIIAVLANDLDPAGGGLTVAGITPPQHGQASIDSGATTVTYTPDPTFDGLDRFTYTLHDADGRTDVALVAVVVTARDASRADPQVAPIDPVQPGYAIFTDTHTTTTLATPVNVYTGTLEPKEIFYLVYTPIITPTGDVDQEPGGLKFGNFVFHLEAYRNDQLLPGYRFAQPITLTIAYAPEILDGLVEHSLTLYTWNGTTWEMDGITILNHSTDSHVVIVQLTHLSEFTFFAAAPSGLDPDPEPGRVPGGLFLPAVMCQSTCVMAQAPGVTSPVSPMTDEEMGALPPVLYLPVLAR